MNNLMKRMGAGVLALFMVVSLLVGVIPADTFAASYTYNSGTRHDYNVSLSDQAEAYYTGNYTWDKLSNLEGGNESCLNIDNPLFEALHDLMANTMTNSVSYSSLPSYWAKTDASAGSKSYVLFYTDIAGPNGNMNREHVWPKSHGSFNEKNAGCDLHHLRPTVGNVNSSRGNLVMGNVKGKSGASEYKYNGKVVLYKTSSLCEVNDNIKGDVARILLYVWCRWEEPNLFMNTSKPVVGPNDNANDGKKVIESLDTLLEWCKIDPVDTWEMSRNDQVQNVQGNRNVFIDYPEFAWLVFGQDVPTDLNTPSDNASGGVSGKPSDGNNGGSNSGNNGGSSSGGTTDTSYTQVSSLKDGDKILIVNPGSNMALSATKTGFYNVGVDVSGGFSGITDAEIFTVKKNGDGTWSFTSGTGKKLALAAEYNSLNDTGSNDKWELTSAGTNQFYMKNVGRGVYLDWYADKSNWSTYNPETLDANYVLAFYTKASSGNNTGSGSGGGSATPPTTKPPATQPPATQPPATQPPATQPATQPATPPASQPGTSENTSQPGTQTSTPSDTPAPLPAASVPVPTLPQQNDNSNSGTWILIVVIILVVLAAGGVVVYIFVIKPKKEKSE